MINHHRVLSFVLPILNIVVCFPLDQFFPYGSSAGDGQLAACDDCSTSSIPIAGNFSFFGSSFDSIYVSILLKLADIFYHHYVITICVWYCLF